MSNEQTKHSSWEYFLLRAARKISLSAAQYSVIDARYSQLEKILSAADDPLLADAHIFPQGSMRLQTTINPVPGAPADLGTIDADAIVWLPHARGIDARTVLEVIERRFQEGSRVQEDIQRLRRGVRIVYADENPGFHIDVTPARPCHHNEQSDGLGMLEVPDREHGWKASSPIPYADWLHDASKQDIMLEHVVEFNKSHAAIDSATQAPLPEYKGTGMNGRSGRKMKDIGLFRQLSPRLRLTLIWMLSRSQYIPPSPRFRLSWQSLTGCLTIFTVTVMSITSAILKITARILRKNGIVRMKVINTLMPLINGMRVPVRR